MKIEINEFGVLKMTYESHYDPKSPIAKEIQVGQYIVLTSTPGIGVEKNCWEQLMNNNTMPQPLKRYSGKDGCVRQNGTYIMLGDLLNQMRPT